MKKLSSLSFILLASLIFFSCSKSDEKSNTVDLKNGLYYKAGTDSLYTGDIKAKEKERIVEYRIVDGKKNGPFKILFLNGQPEILGQLMNNKNFGLWKYYYPDGQLESQGKFQNDLPNGIWKWFYENGNIKEEGAYVKGLSQGKWIQYAIDGSVKSSKMYDDGKEVVNENGKKIIDKKLK